VAHATAIIEKVNSPAPQILDRAAKKWIDELRAPELAGSDPYHRDGYLFQLISWIAAFKSYPEAILQGPHSRLADKGFDSLILERLASNSSQDPNQALYCLVVGEDKATENPRDEIREKVWPSLKEWDAGKRDTEIQAVLPALIPPGLTDLQKIAMIDELFSRQKRFRVAMTVPFDETNAIRRRALFKDYDTTIPGDDVLRRRGDIMRFHDLRGWMKQFSEALAKRLEALIPSSI
jgi:hypothetical protein